MDVAAKLIAIYFPQFHAVPENDQWWGAGFTDWGSVRAGEPQFPGHNQPRKPLNANYYDESLIETLHWQIDLGKKHGIFGFCHYHYWFDGKQLLETPTNMMLENKDLDFPFCLSWANETWSRCWDGRNNVTLIQQTSSGEGKSLNEILETLEKILGRPVACNYRDARKFDVPISVLDNTLAHRELDWIPKVSFYEGLARTVRRFETE